MDELSKHFLIESIKTCQNRKRTYPPTPLGCPIFVIIPDKGILKVEG